jgi:hypothetical protein
MQKTRQLPFKVHSYRRSGTHWLMAAVHKNFVLPDCSCECSTGEGHKWQNTGLTSVTVPWGRLFGTHAAYSPKMASERILYIWRNPVSVMHSLYYFTGAECVFQEFCTIERLKEWAEHVEGYKRAGVFTVTYEQLRKNYWNTLKSIGENWGLQIKEQAPVPVTEAVGWSSREKENMTVEDAFMLTGKLSHVWKELDEYT